MPALTLTRGTIRALLTIAPTTDVRYYMVGARVKTDARGTIVEATDGHAMIRVRVSPVPAPLTSTIIPRALLEGAAGKGKKTLLDAVQVDIQSDGTITRSASRASVAHCSITRAGGRGSVSANSGASRASSANRSSPLRIWPITWLRIARPP